MKIECTKRENEDAMASELFTSCIVCGEKILLSEMQSALVPKMCDKCKDAIMFIKRMRSKETVSVVRCKDCKWHDNADDSPKYLPCMEMKTNPNWFCADGERKEGR